MVNGVQCNKKRSTKPPGLFFNQAPITPTGGGGSNAMLTDLDNLFAALAAKSGGKTAVIVAALPQAKSSSSPPDRNFRPTSSRRLRSPPALWLCWRSRVS
jgi:hypothetical protein